MATVNKTNKRLGVEGSATSRQVWTPLTTTDADGEPLQSPGYADKTVQVTGTPGAGLQLEIEGSNDFDAKNPGSATWHTLTDFQGNALTLSGLGIHTIAENPLAIRPRVVAGDGSTSLTVTVIAKAV